MSTVLGLLAVLGLVFVNGFFVAAEFSLVGARRTRIAQLAEEGHVGAQVAQDAINHLDNYIAATQLGITLASLGLGWIGEPAMAHLIDPVLEAILPHDLVGAAMHSISIAVAFSLVTTLHIVLGELAPKSIALQRPEGTSIIVARPTTMFFHLFRPVIWLMNTVGNGVVRLMGFEPASGHEQVHSAEELLMLVQSAHEAGVLEDSEERLLHRVFDFREIHIREVMQPRVEVEGISLHITLPELLEKVSTGPYSRYPVYRDSIDHVVGVLHAKDLLDKIVHKPDLLTGNQDFDFNTVLRTPLFFPEMASVDRVLEQMQRAQTHFTVVVDEYGGMAGIATMEDILEELVGEVQDEFDTETAPIREGEGTSVLDGLVSLNEVIERFGMPNCEAHSSTIGGYVAECLDRIPTKGDQVVFGPYNVVVDEMDEMRVARVIFMPRGTSLTPATDESSPAPAPARRPAAAQSPHTPPA
ncbi:MAG: HlyC/CorC family transporter [Anaerolineae bacterium]|nr:HlyC/CorC family transporter [Anaerolineae bacterium]